MVPGPPRGRPRRLGRAAVLAAGPGVVPLRRKDRRSRGSRAVGHGQGLRTTYEPVDADAGVGDRVDARRPARDGEPGGRPTATACLHWGAIRGEPYVDPLQLLGLVPPVLLPMAGEGRSRARCSELLAPCGVSAHLGQLGAQLQHRLGVDLADARLGHPEHVADLGEREALVVVERDDDLLALGQLVDRPREQELRLLRLERLDRVLRLGVLEGVDQAELVALLPADREELVERHDVDVGDLGEDLVQVLDAMPSAAATSASVGVRCSSPSSVA